MIDKKIILIAHYYAPLNVTGAKRPEALSRYIACEGGKVTVLTTGKKNKNRRCENLDENIEIIESSIFRTVRYRGMCVSEKLDNESSVVFLKNMLLSVKHKIINKYVGQLIDVRIFFVLNIAIKVLLYKISFGIFFKWLKSVFEADVIISTAPPWPCHLLGVFLSKISKVKLIIDYRDQFSSNHMFSNNFLLLEKKIDKFLNDNADLVVCVSKPMADYYQGISHTENAVVMNGFDESLFLSAGNSINKEGKKFIIRYFGTITEDRLMPNLWKAINSKEMVNGISFEFYGNNIILKEHIEKNYPHLLEIIRFEKTVGYSDALKLMLNSDMLLFTETSEFKHSSQKGVLTTKLFEYMGSCRPIFAVIDDKTEAGKIIQKSGLGFVVSNTTEVLYEALRNVKKGIVVMPNKDYIDKFSRKSQFDLLGQYINKF